MLERFKVAADDELRVEVDLLRRHDGLGLDVPDEDLRRDLPHLERRDAHLLPPIQGDSLELDAWVVRYRRKRHYRYLWVAVSRLTRQVLAFFVGVMVFMANPFDKLPFVPADGEGINPASDEEIAEATDIPLEAVVSELDHLGRAMGLEAMPHADQRAEIALLAMRSGLVGADEGG
jgi:hypothetical protein